MGKPSRWQIFKTKLSLGHPFSPTVDLGQIDDHTVIRFKGYYIDVIEKGGEIISQGWSTDPHMFPDVNINDFWLATKEKP